jgi:benzoylformate decarboxylase
MASYTGADLFVNTLEQYGVTHVFGNPGTTELPVVRALADSNIEYVLGLHEDIAVGAAAGYAQTQRYLADAEGRSNRASGTNGILPLGVVNLHVAPGLAHGLGNVYNASFTGAPLLVTAGNYAIDQRHEEPILSGDLVRMARQHCKWSDEVLDVSVLPTVLRRAIRVALTPPTGPVFLSLPIDVMGDQTDATPERLGGIPTAGRGDAEAVAQATDLLVEAEIPALVVGDGVARSGGDAIAAAVEFAEATGARVFGEMIPAEINFPSDHEQWVRYVPNDGERAREVQDIDTLVFAGCSTNVPLLPHEESIVPRDSATIHISDDAWELGKNNPADVAVFGDPGDVLGELAGLVEERLSAVEQETRIDSAKEASAAEQERRETTGTADPDDPRVSKAELVDALARAAPDALVADEGVTTKYVDLVRRTFEPRQHFSNKGGGLGYGLPAAVGAAIAEREQDDPRDVIGLIGDGTYLYYPHTVYTAARYDIDITIVVADNLNYRILKENTVGLYGGEVEDHDYVGMDFEPPVDIPMNAESHGARGEFVDDPACVEDVIRDAVSQTGPDVLDVLVQD